MCAGSFTSAWRAPFVIVVAAEARRAAAPLQPPLQPLPRANLTALLLHSHAFYAMNEPWACHRPPVPPWDLQHLSPSQGSEQVQIWHHPLQNDSPMRLSLLWSMLQWGMKYLSSSDVEIISSGNYKERILNALTQMIVWTGNITYFMCIDFQIEKWDFQIEKWAFVRSLRAWCRGQRLIDIFCFPIHTLRKL